MGFNFRIFRGDVVSVISLFLINLFNNDFNKVYKLIFMNGSIGLLVWNVVRKGLICFVIDEKKVIFVGIKGL